MTDTFNDQAALAALREDAEARDQAMAHLVSTYSAVQRLEREREDAVKEHQLARKAVETYGITDAALKRAGIQPVKAASPAKSTKRGGPAKKRSGTAGPAPQQPPAAEGQPPADEQIAS